MSRDWELAALDSTRMLDHACFFGCLTCLERKVARNRTTRTPTLPATESSTDDEEMDA